MGRTSLRSNATRVSGDQPVSLNPMVKAMFGQLAPIGKLPVTITEPPPSTTVLYPFGFGLSP